MNEHYNKIIEKYIQKFWKKNKTFKSVEDTSKEKYYCLSMFPYPSGNLHLGHVRNYTIGDILARFNRMIGKNVLYPIGWDAFGLPAENAAINNNLSPKEWTFLNINYMRKQLKLLGFSFDWSREIITCDKNYYKWDQLFFKDLYNKKIAYKKYSPINWCNTDKTVLANEQVINNKCWRCNSKVSIKYINQWFLKISNYSEELLNNLKLLRFWPNKIKLMQSNWIGKSKWFKTEFILINLNFIRIIVYFKNIEEFVNISNISISLKHNLFKKIIKKIINFKNLKLYGNDIYKHIKKYGYLKTNIIATHSLINKYIPIIIFNNNYFLYIYILKYIEFNNNFFNLNISYKDINLKKVNENLTKYYLNLQNAYCINYLHPINKKINYININYINIIGIIKYKINDWCISRQRYWGAPIPAIKSSKGKLLLVPDDNIPMKLGEFKDYYSNKKEDNKICINNKIFYKENDTFDTFIQSSWYYIRYTSPKYKSMINKKNSNYWLPVDQYIGGIEHATMHLLYFRFYNKLLRDFNYLKIEEPAIKLLCQGMVLSKTYYYIDNFNKKKWISCSKIVYDKENIYDKDGNKLYFDGFKKMSKSKNNGINPNKIIEKYGSDTLRVFLIFLCPAKSNLIWDESKILGIYKFLNKVWKLVFNHINNKKILYSKLYEKNEKLLIYINKIIKNITYDIKIKQSFNTSISYLMNLTNLLIKIVLKKKYNYFFIHDLISSLLKMLYPFAPHISFFLWNKIGYSNIDYSKWPSLYAYNKNNKYIYYMIYINNKFKLKILVKNNIEKENILKEVEKNKKIKSFIDKKNIIRIIFIKNKLINFLFN